MKSRPIVIVSFILLLLPMGMKGYAAESRAGLQQKVDSIFVIASSGEIMYRDKVQPAIDDLAAMGEAVVPLLIDKFTTKSARERLTIIEILKKIGSSTLPYLIPALSRSDDLVVERVCWALGDVGDPAAVEPLIGMIQHRSWQVREKAIDALGKLEDNSADGPIMSALTDSIGQVRKAAAVALGRLGANSAIRPLVSSLGDTFYGARMSAMEALLLLDTASVLTAVSDSMIAVNRIVGDLGCRTLGLFATDAARDILLKQVEFGDKQRRIHAAVAIVHSDPYNHCGFHEQLLAGETDRLNRIKIQSLISSVGDEPKEN